MVKINRHYRAWLEAVNTGYSLEFVCRRRKLSYINVIRFCVSNKLQLPKTEYAKAKEKKARQSPRQ